MSSATVVVTGVGALIGQGAVRSLRRSGRDVRVVGVDRDPGCVGPALCDAFHAKPPVDEASPGYLRFWRDLLEAEAADLVLPALEVDVAYLDAHRSELGGGEAVLGLNRPEVISWSRDKWRMGEELEGAGPRAIPATLADRWSACVEELGEPPFMVKPRVGDGSRGVAVVCDEVEWRAARAVAGGREGAVTQRRVGDDDHEYTVGVFGLGDGRSLPPIVFRRRLSKQGNTAFAEVVDAPAVVEACDRLTERLRPLGPTNYQLRAEGEAVYLLEVNPRLSSSTSLRMEFGFNEAAMAVRLWVDGVEPAPPTVRAGRGWRLSSDLVELA